MYIFDLSIGVDYFLRYMEVYPFERELSSSNSAYFSRGDY